VFLFRETFWFGLVYGIPFYGRDGMSVVYINFSLDYEVDSERASDGGQKHARWWNLMTRRS
jgi:hypothetical protein